MNGLWNYFHSRKTNNEVSMGLGNEEKRGKKNGKLAVFPSAWKFAENWQHLRHFLFATCLFLVSLSLSPLFFLFAARKEKSDVTRVDCRENWIEKPTKIALFFSFFSVFFFFVSVAKLTNVKLRNEAHGCRCSTEFNFISEFALCTCYTLVGRH